MRKAGSIVLERLRDRILLGRYFGCWSPGDRLPSVRDVARLEDVDRKTAAAAYRRLESEGLVRVEARSGVYLRGDDREDLPDPLRRLHRQWLEQALATANELGLDSAAVIRMLQAVAAVESRRIPVIDADTAHATLVAREISDRTGLDCTACRIPELGAGLSLKDAPFLVATPSVSVRLRPYQRRLPVIHATLAPALLDDLRAWAARGPVLVVVGTDGLVRELEQAVEHGLVGPRDRIAVARPASASELDRLRDGRSLVTWPGAPEWARDRRDRNGNRPHLLAQSTLHEIRQQIARSALDYVSRSTAGGSPGTTAAGPGLRG